MARTPRPMFTIFGFPVYVPMSAWIGIALIAVINSPAFEQYGGAVSTVLYAVGLYATVLVHELAHALAARRTGHAVLAITLGILGGATMYDEQRNPNPKHEFGVALVGPLASIAVGFALGFGADGLQSASAAAVVGALGFMNVLLGFMNLLPAAPLDGGHVLEAAVWRITGSRRTGMRATAIVGWVLGSLAVSSGVGGRRTSGTQLLLFLGLLFVFDAAVTWRRSRLYS